MTTTTAAVLRTTDGPFRLEQVTLGELGPHDTLVQIVGVGFCHTDLMPRGMGAYVLPGILGHEGAGKVIEVGTQVSTLKPGDSVVLSFASCGDCLQCRAGSPAYCVAFLALNMTGRDIAGGTSAVDADGAPLTNRWFGQSSFAGHAIVNERSAVVVDADLPLQIMGPLGCGIQTGAGAVLNEMRLAAGQSLVVFGAGAVGLAAIMAAKVARASEIVAVDLHQNRLDLALELGATRVVRASAPDVVGSAVGDSGGLDFALDTTAVGSVMEQAIKSIRAGGEVVLVGAGSDGLAIHPSTLAGKRVTYVLEGSADPQRFIPKLVGLWQSGDFPFDRLIATYPLADIGTAEADTRSGKVIKPVLLIGSK